VKKFDKGELVKKILLAAVASGVLATVIVLPGMSILFKMFDARTSSDRYRIQRTIRRLEAQGAIVRRIRDGREERVITSKGKKKIVKLLIDDLYITRMEKWDGIWRLVMFDIPEEKGLIRRDVSSHLRQIGLKAIQNSVFITPFPCKDQVDTITTFHDIKKHFIYLEATTYEGVGDLLKYFKLK
jgi:phenylacetic acid degradation operon negative regulatory protein